MPHPRDRVDLIKPAGDYGWCAGPHRRRQERESTTDERPVLSLRSSAAEIAPAMAEPEMRSPIAGQVGNELFADLTCCASYSRSGPEVRVIITT